jgi:potassium efflux system protein
VNRTRFRATAAVSRALAGIAVLVSTALPAWAQEAAQTTRPDSTQSVSPRPIPPSDIPERALRVGTALAAFRGQVSSDTAVRGIATALTDLTGRVRTATTDLGPVQLRGQSFENLADLEREWRGYERQVSEWQNRLGDRSAQLNAMQDSLRRMQASWRLTRDSTPRRDLPPELRQRIERVLLSVDSVQSRLRQPLGDLLALQDHAAQLQVQITDALSTIRTAQDTARRRLLEADYPPIWHLFVSDSTGPPPTGSLVAKLRPAKAYFDAHPQRLAYQGLFFVLLIAAMFALRRRSVRWVTAEHLIQSPAQLFARPNAAAFLVTLATTRVFQPGAPQAVYGLAWILALPALLLLLPTAVGRDARRPAHVFAALFAIALLTDLLISHPLIGRLALLAVTALAGVGLLHLIRVTATRERARTSVWWRIARFAIWLGLGLLVGSLGANLLGYVALSRVVAAAVVNASFAAVVLVAFATVLIGMYVVFLETTVSRVLRVVQAHRQTLVRGGAAVIRLGLLLWWLVLVLQMLRIAQLVWHDVKVVFGYQAHIGTWSISLGEIFTFVVALWLGMTAARAMRALLRDDVLTRIELPRGMPDAVSKLAYYVVAALGFLFAIGAAGIDLGKLTLLVGALGIGIGFGLQTIVNNFISGLILLFERPIQIGDTIEVGGLLGTVQAIGIRASTVRTFDGAEVIVPNADLISTQVTNWTLSDRLRRIETPIGVAYGSDPANVLSILQGVAERNPKVLTNPTPMVLFVGFGDSSLNFALRAWTADFDTWLQVRSDLYTEIYAALAAAGIEIPFPQRDLHLRSVDAAAAGALSHSPVGGEPTAP